MRLGLIFLKERPQVIIRRRSLRPKAFYAVENAYGDYQDKYIVGKDQFDGFRNRDYEGGPSGIGYQVRQAGVALGGTRYSNPDGTGFDHSEYLKDVWTDPYILVGAAHATVASLPKAPGMMRAIKYSSNWQNASLKDAINKFAPGVEGVETSTGKTLYPNNQTGIQIVLDNDGGYFRIENTKLTGARKYLDLDGNVPNNKTVNGKQSRRSKSEYEAVTHFNNSDDL